MLIVMTFVALIGCTEPQDAGPNEPLISRARAAFMSNDLAAAERKYRDVLQGDTTRAHRSEAVRTLASIAWRVRADSSETSRFLAPFFGDSAIRLPALLEKSRMFTASGTTARLELLPIQPRLFRKVKPTGAQHSWPAPPRAALLPRSPIQL